MRQLLERPDRDGSRVPRAVAGPLLFLLVAGTTAGCGGDRRETAVVDSVLSRDLTLAGSSTGNVALGDTAVRAPSAPTATPVPPTTVASNTPTPPRAVPTPAPVRRPAPRPAPVTRAPVPTPVPEPTPVATAPSPAPAATPAPTPARLAIGTGTVLSGPTSAAICSLANRPGDRFVVSLDRDVEGPDGARLAAGTPILIEMAAPGADSAFAFRMKGVQVNGEFIPAEGTVRVAEAQTSERQVAKGNDRSKVATGVIAGAILGRVLGGGTKGTVIGAAAGGAAGTIAARRDRVTERCMAAGATISVTLSAPLVLPNSAP